MATDRAIAAAFAALSSGGCRRPRDHEDRRMLSLAMRLYGDILGDLDDEAVELAVFRYLRGPQSHWWPTPGQLLALADTCKRLTADEAWGHLLIAAKRHHKRPERLHDDDVTSDAIAQAISAIGGWARLGELPDLAYAPQRAIEWTATAASFRRAYDGAATRAADDLDAETCKGLLVEIDRRRENLLTNIKRLPGD